MIDLTKRTRGRFLVINLSLLLTSQSFYIVKKQASLADIIDEQCEVINLSTHDFSKNASSLHITVHQWKGLLDPAENYRKCPCLAPLPYIFEV
jgi:hypothetical protein